MNSISSRKRKTLHDYFASEVPKQPLHKTPKKSPDLKSPPSPISGLSVIPNFVSSIEESSLLSFLAAQKWRTDLSRRTIHYGGTYCLMPPRNATPDERKRVENTILTADPIPSELTWLIDRMVDQDLYIAKGRPEFCIVYAALFAFHPLLPPSCCLFLVSTRSIYFSTADVHARNEYTSTLGISAHVENFRFDEPVCALTLGDADSMRFHELSRPHDGSVRTGKAVGAPRTGHKVDVWLPNRSLLVMTGEARWKWQHEIVRGRKRTGTWGDWKRVSLTFRVEKKPAKGAWLPENTGN